MPIFGTVKISAGNMAYGALMMSSILFVIIERDLFILRNIVRLVITVNVFKVLLFLTLSMGLDTEGIINPNDTSAALFNVSVKFTILGGVLIVGELILLFFIFEQMKKLTTNLFYLSASYIAFFILVLCLDGVLFLAIAFGFSSKMIDIVFGGVQGKLIMASAYSIPMMLFLVIYRNKLSQYIEHPPI